VWRLAALAGATLAAVLVVRALRARSESDAVTERPWLADWTPEWDPYPIGQATWTA
jgi:hypothetical protein